MPLPLAGEKMESVMRLYVGNLSYGTTDALLKTTFGEFGTVDEAVVIMDRDTGRSKGFGFVTMNNDEEGKAALAALDGKDLDGRTVKVNEARPMEDRRPSGGNRW
jgi:cold-inducible RNA-binding protein